MNRGRWTWSNELQQLVPYVQERPRSAPSVITDEMPAIRSMADSRTYTSKSKLRESYRRLGKVEIGNDTEYIPTPDPHEREKRQADIREDLERAWYDLRDNNAREMDEASRERCRRIDYNLREYNYDRRERDRDGNV